MEKSSMNCDHVITDALTAVIFTSSGSSIVTEVLDTGGSTAADSGLEIRSLGILHIFTSQQ